MTNVWVASVSATIAFIAMIITFINVNRTQRKNLKNDIERFKRDLELKAADELIDCIINLTESIQEISNFKVRWSMYMSNKISDEIMKQRIKEIIDDLHSRTVKLIAQNRKREIIYNKFSNDLAVIYESTVSLTLHFMLFGAKYIDGALVGRSDQEIGKMISELESEANPLLEKVDSLLQGIQNEFLGKIFSNSTNK